MKKQNNIFTTKYYGNRQLPTCRNWKLPKEACPCNLWHRMIIKNIHGTEIKVEIPDDQNMNNDDYNDYDNGYVDDYIYDYTCGNVINNQNDSYSVSEYISNLNSIDLNEITMRIVEDLDNDENDDDYDYIDNEFNNDVNKVIRMMIKNNKKRGNEWIEYSNEKSFMETE